MKLLVTVLYVLVSFTSMFSILHAPSAALSEHVVLYQIQTGGAGSGTATQELILLHNTSDIDIEVTGWCVAYSSASDNPGFRACLEAPEAGIQLWLSAQSFVSFASPEFVAANPGFIPDAVMIGGMSAVSGHVRLLTAADEEVDKVGWGLAVLPETTAATAHTSGNVLSRDLQAELVDSDNNALDFTSASVHNPIVSGLYEVEFPLDECLNIEGLQTELPEGFLPDETNDCYQDICSNLDGLQKTLPAGYEQLAETLLCEEMPLEDSTLVITELLPNPPSYDSGAEFIELYNPNNRPIHLTGYRLEVGPNFTKSFTFADGSIPPNGYQTVTDDTTGITLTNSSGVQLRLVSPAGTVVSTSELYSNAGDDVSWALIDDQWVYTNQITPNAANKPYLEPAIEEVLGTTSILAPCPAGKYRNPETNRCRTLETAVSQLVPCAEDEYRNPETNRCRKIATASTSLQPCQPGYERNPETNRCRKVSVLAATSEESLPTVTDIPTTPTEANLNWSIIALAVLLSGSYMVYEWRTEILQMTLRNNRV